MKKDTNRFRSWFDNLEVHLEKEADLAGLFQHPTLTGSAREFLVKRVLKSVLPPSVHIGGGRIFNRLGNCSKQVDIIIYDSRFPILEIEAGIGMYLIEGVISTIEVKSILTGDSLEEALNNTLSILNLSPDVVKASQIRFAESALKFMTEHGLTQVEAMRRHYYKLIPSSYVFAFSSNLKAETLSGKVNEWFQQKVEPTASKGLCNLLPRIIVAGKTIGILDDGIFLIEPDPDAMKRAIQEDGPETKHVMAFWDLDYRFGIFVSHAVLTACNRYGLSHGAVDVRYAIDLYLPVEEYFSTELPETVWHIFRKKGYEGV